MQIGTSEVTGEKRSLGNCEYAVYETVDEALNDETYGLGEARLLQILNAQVRTNAMNALRTSKTKGPTKASLRTDAMNEIMEEFAGGEHQDVIGNKAALEALIERRMSSLESRAKEARVADGTDENDE